MGPEQRQYNKVAFCLRPYLSATCADYVCCVVLLSNIVAEDDAEPSAPTFVIGMFDLLKMFAPF